MAKRKRKLSKYDWRTKEGKKQWAAILLSQLREDLAHCIPHYIEKVREIERLLAGKSINPKKDKQ